MSDIVLNDLSTYYGFIKSLQPYFYKQSILSCAAAAGITVIIVLILTMLVSYSLFGFIIPKKIYELFQFSILAFCLGYIADIFIEKQKIFGSRLEAYYKSVGAGIWGAIAFVFSILISYFIQKNIIPLLY
jgi:hypothetical protein